MLIHSHNINPGMHFQEDILFYISAVVLCLISCTYSTLDEWSNYTPVAGISLENLTVQVLKTKHHIKRTNHAKCQKTLNSVLWNSKYKSSIYYAMINHP